MRVKGLFFLLCLLVGLSGAAAGELYERLAALQGVVSVQELEQGVFRERYLVVLEQPLEHTRPEAGSFRQRIFIGHAGADSTTVLVTEGYSGGVAFNPRYREEVTERLGSNQILVEHRYFGESVPVPGGWEHLTARNAAADLHTIRQLMAEIYPRKWIATGISKGGTNTLIYGMLYPDDTHALLTYGAPVCFSAEDERPAERLLTVGDSLRRAIVREFQTEVLSRRETILPLFEVYCDEHHYSFQVPIEEVFDLCILEYSFAFWQWGRSTGQIPAPESSDMALFAHLMRGSSPQYFTASSLPAFFVQAARELGYYSYDTIPFQGLLAIPDVHGYLHRVFLPRELQDMEFSDTLSRQIETFYRENDPRLIGIYGEYDPWMAAMPDSSLYEGKTRMHFFTQPSGSHRARIETLPAAEQQRVWQIVEAWIRED